MDEPKLSWARTPDDLPERWPKTADGTPEAPVFLTHRFDTWDINMLEQMLRSYDIPVLKSRGNLGSLGTIVLGFSGEGVDLFVPESLLEDARNLLKPVDESALEDAENDN